MRNRAASPAHGVVRRLVIEGLVGPTQGVQDALRKVGAVGGHQGIDRELDLGGRAASSTRSLLGWSRMFAILVQCIIDELNKAGKTWQTEILHTLPELTSPNLPATLAPS